MVLTTGKAIGQGLGQGLGKLMNMGLGTELIYSFIIIVCSLMIYFGTKELYELSSHKGIKYFRQAFLFFAIAYFFRSFIKFLLTSFNVSRIFDVSYRMLNFTFGQITLFVFMYFSFMAMFYLLYSFVWKKWNGNSKKIYLFHLASLFLSGIIILTQSALVYLCLNALILLFIIYAVCTASKCSKKKSKKHPLFLIYVLLFIFWILNILDILVPNFFQTFQILIYLISLGIFMTILYKVLTKTGSK